MGLASAWLFDRLAVWKGKRLPKPENLWSRDHDPGAWCAAHRQPGGVADRYVRCGWGISDYTFVEYCAGCADADCGGHICGSDPGVSTSALYDRRHTDKPAVKMVIVLFGGNFIGVQLGASLLAYLAKLGNLRFGANTIAIADLALWLIFLPLLLGIAWWLYHDTHRNPESLLYE